MYLTCSDFFIILATVYLASVHHKKIKIPVQRDESFAIFCPFFGRGMVEFCLIQPIFCPVDQIFVLIFGFWNNNMFVALKQHWAFFPHNFCPLTQFYPLNYILSIYLIFKMHSVLLAHISVLSFCMRGPLSSYFVLFIHILLV